MLDAGSGLCNLSYYFLKNLHEDQTISLVEMIPINDEMYNNLKQFKNIHVYVTNFYE